MSSQKRQPVLPLLILCLSLVGGIFYFFHRASVFPIPPQENWLDHPLSNQDIHNILSPIVDVPVDSLSFHATTYADRNSIKYLLTHFSRGEFEILLQNENTPLWGWDVHIKSPFSMNFRISQNKKIISLEFLSVDNYPKLATNDVFDSMVRMMGKQFTFDRNRLNAPYQVREEISFNRNIGGSDLLEKTTFTWLRGYLQKVETELLLPSTYAQKINGNIEKQKNLHHVFNVLHYLLIGLVFLFLFRVHETQSLYWKRCLPIFTVYFVANFFTEVFASAVSSHWIRASVDSLLKIIADSAWIYLLIVVADYIARTNSSSKYSLSDIYKRSFFRTSIFRTSILAGWTLALTQIVFVYVFYRVASGLHFYIPLKIPGEHSLRYSWEFLRYFFDGLSTSIYEETLYRVFFIYFFTTILKKNYRAIFFSAVIWGFLHLSYQFEPYYIRGIELSIIGVLYGFVLIEYGALAVITAHFLYNGWILSEYEYQFAGYFVAVHIGLIALWSISNYFKKNDSSFKFQYFDLPKFNIKTLIKRERRSFDNQIYPVSWKYGLFVLVALLIFLAWFPARHLRPNMYPSYEKLKQISSKIIEPYVPSEKIWSMIYQRENKEVQNLKEDLRQQQQREKKVRAISELEPYTYQWSVRYFTKADNRVFCDLDYSYDYELLRINCPEVADKDIHTNLDFFDWVRRIKSPEENWTLVNLQPGPAGRAFYNYQVVQEDRTLLRKNAFMSFRDQQLYFFKKDIGTFLIQDGLSGGPPIPYEWTAVGVSLVAILFLICTLHFLLEVIRKHGFYERKALYGAAITFVLYLAWYLNSYKSVLAGIEYGVSLYHVLVRQSFYLLIKSVMISFIAYVLFYAFFYFPKSVFEQAPTNSDWNSILKRPVWKWRNAKASLFYSILLLCIQIFLRFLIQVDNGLSSFDLFRFNVQYLNHEYLLITFLGVIWKNLLFWLAVTVIVSALEKHLSRWIYLPILCGLVLVDVLYSTQSLNSKLIELCSIYIVFYFVYNISKFDFAFYFWFIFLNSLLAFLPILFYSGYQMYFYQVFFIYVLGGAAMIYTLFRNRSKVVSHGVIR